MNKQTGQTLPDIRHSQTFNAPIDRVWSAVATSEGIAAWFMPNTFQPVEGGEFTLDAGPFGISPCKVTELEPPSRLSFQWGKDWVVTFELKAAGDRTEFTLIHSGWDADTLTEFGQPHAAIRERMDHGWANLVLALQSRVEAA